MIRQAQTTEAEILTRVSLDAKGYWNYPRAYMALWKSELTIRAEYIAHNDVFVFAHEDKVVGYYAIVELKNDKQVDGITISRGHWLEHMFITPGHIGQGIGRRLFMHMRRRCQAIGIKEIRILADPHARGFYEKMGCQYQAEWPSNIPNRTTPLLSCTMKNRCR